MRLVRNVVFLILLATFWAARTDGVRAYQCLGTETVDGCSWARFTYGSQAECWSDMYDPADCCSDWCYEVLGADILLTACINRGSYWEGNCLCDYLCPGG